MEQRLIFDEVADLYDRYRPDYPERLAVDLLQMANVQPGDRLLEIGCGTGKATIHFARTGHPLLAIEPGLAMLEIARQACAACPNVVFQNSLFEEWPIENAAFRLIYAAQAIHWVDPDEVFEKIAAALAPGGMLALFANRPQRADSPLEEAIQAAYAKVEEMQPIKAHPKAKESRLLPSERLAVTGLFTPAVQHTYSQHNVTYTADAYVNLMLTMSDHRMLPLDRRNALLAEIHEAIMRFGGSITIDYKIELFYAQRR